MIKKTNYHKRGTKPSCSKMSFNSPNELPPNSSDNKLPQSSNGANTFQQGYMIKKKPRPIPELRREYENDS